MTSNINCDIITPTYNNADLTVACFKSVRKYTTDYRLIWVDNGSDEDQRRQILSEVVKHKDYLTIWLPENYGFITATNAGIDSSSGQRMILLNNDTEVTPEWAERLHIVLDENEDVACVGGLTDTEGSWQCWHKVKERRPDLNIPRLWGSDKTISKRLKKLKGNYFSVSMIAFFASMFRREVMEELGGLDTRFGFGLGDDDWLCHRIKTELKMVIACAPASFVYHHHRTTFKKLLTPKELKTVQDKNMRKFKELIK